MTRRIAVDLTPLLPRGDNGGAKVFALALLRHLAALLADHELVLLTQAASHEELAALDAPNMRRELVMGGAASARRSTLAAAWEGFTAHAPEALTLLTRTAMRDIAHLLRPGHLGQLRAILDDKEASPNDHFVALELLKNANIAAGGVLPGCQDTGTAIVMGKRGQYVVTGGNDEEAISRGIFDT